MAGCDFPKQNKYPLPQEAKLEGSGMTCVLWQSCAFPGEGASYSKLHRGTGGLAEALDSMTRRTTKMFNIIIISPLNEVGREGGPEGETSQVIPGGLHEGGEEFKKDL